MGLLEASNLLSQQELKANMVILRSSFTEGQKQDEMQEAMILKLFRKIKHPIQMNQLCDAFTKETHRDLKMFIYDMVTCP